MPDTERVSYFPLRVWVAVTESTQHWKPEPHCFQCEPDSYVLTGSDTDAGPYTGADSYPDTNDHTHPDANTDPDLRTVATRPSRGLHPQSAVVRVSLTAFLLALVASVAVAIGTVMAGPNEKPTHPGHPPKPSPGIGRSQEPPHGRPTPAPVPTPAPTPVPTPAPGHFDPPLPAPPVTVLPDTRSSP